MKYDIEYQLHQWLPFHKKLYPKSLHTLQFRPIQVRAQSLAEASALTKTPRLSSPSNPSLLSNISLHLL